MNSFPSVYVPGHGFVSMVFIKRLLDKEAVLKLQKARRSKPRRRIVKGRRS